MNSIEKKPRAATTLLGDAKQAEPALWESESRFRLIFDAEPECVKLLGPDGSLLEMNPAGLRMIEADSFQQVANQCFFPLIAEGYRNAFKELTKNVFAGESGILEFEIVGLKGGRRWLETHANPLRDPSGSITALLGITHDITERKRATAELRKTEAINRSIVESSLNCIVAMDHEGRIIEFNPAAERTFGYTREAALGQRVDELIIPPALRRRHRRGLEHNLATGEGPAIGKRLEMTAIRKNGEEFPIELTIARVAGSEPPIFTGSIRDVTERKQAGDALRESEEKYKALFEYAPDGILVTVPGESIVDANASLCRMLGYTRDELLKLKGPDIIAPSEASQIKAAVETIKANKLLQREWLLRRKDGSIFAADVFSTLMPDGHALSMMRDITENKRAESLLRESEELYRDLVENAIDIIYTHDLEGNYTSANRVAETITGYTREEALALNMSAIVAPEYLEKGKQMIAQKLAGEPVTAYELELIAKDGHRVPVEVNTRLIYENGVPIGVQGIARDITERKQQEEARLASEQKYQDIFDLAPVGIYRSLRDGTLLTVNNALAEILGYESTDELLNVNIADLYFNQNERENLIAEYIDIGRVFDLEVQWKRKDGSAIWIQLTSRIIAESQRGQECFESFVRDITETKQMNEAMGESETRLRTIIDTEPECVKLLAKDGSLLEMNPAGLRMIEADSFEQVANQSVYDLIAEDDRDAFRDLTKRVFQGESAKLEHRIVGLKGTHRWLDTHANPLRDATGKITALLGITRDVTERKQVEEALQQSEVRFRNLFDSSPDPIWIIDGHKFVECNNAAVKMLGYPDKGALSNTHPSELSPEFQPDGEASYSKAERMMFMAQENGLNRFEWVHRRFDKSDFYAEVTLSTIMLQGRQVIYCVWRDVTESKRADEELRESNEKFQQLAENITDVFWIRSPDLRKLYYVSPAYERIFGRTTDSQYANPEEWVDYIHPDDRERVLSSFASLTREESSLDIEYRIVRPDGEIRWVCARGFPVRDDAQIVTRYVGILTDITARKRTELQLNIEYQISRVLAESATLKQASSGILRTICENMNWEVGEFWNVDNRAGVMRFDDMWVAPDIRADEFSRVSRKTTFARGVGLPGQVWASGKPAWIPDVVVHGNFLRTAEAKKAGLHSAFSFPILAGNEVIGAIEFFGRERRQPDEELLSMFAVLGSLLGQFFERKRSDEAMRESEEKYRTILENIEDGYFEVDIAGNLTFFNDSLCGILGYPRDEMLGMNNRDFMDTQDFAKVYKAFNEVYRTGEPAEALDWKIIRKDGTKRYVEGSISRRGDSTNQPIGFRGIVRDITESKLVEAKILSEQLFSESIVNSLPGIFYVIDQTGKFLRWNKNLERVTGYSAKEIATLSPLEFFAGEEKELIAQKIQEVFASGAADAEAHLVSKNGQSTSYYFTGVRIDSNDQPCLIGVGLDITVRKQLEEQFRQSQKMEAVGQLAGGVAHDFNNLLTAINGYSDLTLRRMPPDDRFRDNIQEIRKAGGRAAELTEQLLVFSRKQILQPRVLNLNSVITEIDGMLRRLIREDIEYISVLDPGLGNTKGDPGQIGQVIVNLAVNARDAMPGGGTLTIKTENVLFDEDHIGMTLAVVPGPFVKLTVTDSGEGMEAKTMDRIFEPFFTTKPVGKGTGLGLSTVHGIVKQSGGDIAIHSEKGKGTTFEVYLPCVDESVERPKWTGDEEADYSGTETILLVEDEEIVRKFALEVLTSNGYHVLEADCGKAALSICDAYSGPIHMMLTDVIMPKMSGIELKDLVVKFHPEIKTLLMSGYTADALTHDETLDPDTAFIEKPFTYDGLSGRVREVLGS